jgi:hypothetical protein
LNNLGILLSELGRRDEVAGAFAAAWRDLSPGPRAQLRLALMSWLAADRDAPEPVDLTQSPWWGEMAAAVADANAEPRADRAAPARRAVRAAFTAAGLVGQVADPPVWLSADIPDDVIAVLNQLLAEASWRRRAPLLRAPDADVLWIEPGRSALAALAGLYADNPALVTMVSVLDAAVEHGLDTVLDEVCEAEGHVELLSGWVDTPTWTASRRYLAEHPGLLTDPRTPAVLVQAGGDHVARQHLAIVRLHGAGMGTDEVYDTIVDASDATDAALAALDSGDLDRAGELWYASPHLARHPFLAPYLAAVLYAVAGDVEQAEALITTAAADADQPVRTTAAARLRRVAAHLPAHASSLVRLAELMQDDHTSVAPVTSHDG